MNDRPDQLLERQLLDALRNRDTPKREILRQASDLPEGKFKHKEAWLELSCTADLEDWRRLAAYELLITRCITYPCDLDLFVREVIAPLGIERSQIVDMTMGQYVPIKRRGKKSILMANLPIPILAGRPAVYFAVERSTKLVTEAAVHPHPADLGTV